jgi:uncharacterized membrane protein
MTSKKVTVGAANYTKVAQALFVSNAACLLLFLLRSIESDTNRYWFLIWNLFLGWLPLGFAWWLSRRLGRRRWSEPGNLLLTFLWLGFLPNSFYLVSDLIHLHVTGEVSLLYDIVMFSLFIFNAYVAGFLSLFLVHRELLKRLSYYQAHTVVGAVLLVCSFAIYLGRSLRWNTWDVLVNPAGLLFDVSDRIINPGAHPQAIVTTSTFFILLGSMYMVIWHLVQALRADNRR